jgi:hypothetical protein
MPRAAEEGDTDRMPRSYSKCNLAKNLVITGGCHR